MNNYSIIEKQMQTLYNIYTDLSRGFDDNLLLTRVTPETVGEGLAPPVWDNPI